MKIQFGIGTQFIQKHTKRRDVETVIDILTETSMKTGHAVSVSYLCEHVFCGQKIIARVPAPAIARGEIIKLVCGPELI